MPLVNKRNNEVQVCWRWCWTEICFFFFFLPKSAAYAFSWLSGEFGEGRKAWNKKIFLNLKQLRNLFLEFSTHFLSDSRHISHGLFLFFAWFLGKIHQKSVMLNSGKIKIKGKRLVKVQYEIKIFLHISNYHHLYIKESWINIIFWHTPFYFFSVIIILKKYISKNQNYRSIFILTVTDL